MSDQNILIVEDEQITALELKSMLKDLGYNVLNLEEKGNRALEAMERTDIDLVLMDIRLPGDLSGIETTAKIKERFSDTPVLYITAHSDDDTLVEARQTQPSGFLIKPISRDDLQTSIEAVIGQMSNQ